MKELEVWELFNRFDEYFDNITYKDLTNRISGYTTEDDSDAPNLQLMHDKFVCEYGKWIVKYWCYSHHDNIIYLEVKENHK